MDEQRGAKTSKYMSASALLLTCSPFLLAFVLTVRTPAGSAVAGQSSRPSLVFAQYLVNRRELPVVPVVDTYFDFWNKGKETLTITELLPSCACLTPRFVDDQRTYEPGEHGRFHVYMRTANEEPGRKEYTVQVNYTCGTEQGSRMVTLKAIVPAMKVSIEPPQLVFYQMNGQPSSQKVYVTDYRGNPIQVASAETPRDDINVIVLDREVDQHGQLRVPILVEVPGNVPPGRTTTRLKIKTTDQEFSELQIPLFLFGPSEKVRMADGETGEHPDEGVRQTAGEAESAHSLSR